MDCTDLRRIKYAIPPANPVVNIDHHISNEFWPAEYSQYPGGRNREMVYYLLREGRIDITPEMATLLYVAVSTDTGSFIYSNTTPETLRIASELLALKADLDLVRKNLHEKRPYNELVMVKTALQSLLLSEDGRIISCRLPYADLERNGLITTDTDGFGGNDESYGRVKLPSFQRDRTGDN